MVSYRIITGGETNWGFPLWTFPNLRSRTRDIQAF